MKFPQFGDLFFDGVKLLVNSHTPDWQDMVANVESIHESSNEKFNASGGVDTYPTVIIGYESLSGGYRQHVYNGSAAEFIFAVAMETYVRD